MSQIIYRLHLDCAGTIHVTYDAPGVRQPRILRVRWTPDVRQQTSLDREQKIGMDGKRVYHIRTEKGQRKWSVDASVFDSLRLETPDHGDAIWMGEIKPPVIRTPGAWLAWETGQWVKHGNGSCQLFERIREEHWHTPAWQKGQDMTPLPPRNAKRHADSLTTGPVEG